MSLSMSEKFDLQDGYRQRTPRKRRLLAILRTVSLFAALTGLTLIGVWVKFGSPRIAVRYLRGERLILEPERIWLTDLDSEPVVVHAEIRNYTAKPVRLVGASLRCTCVFAKELPATIPAGDTFRLPLQVHALPNKPEIDEMIAIYTDDPQRPQMRLRVVGTKRP